MQQNYNNNNNRNKTKMQITPLKFDWNLFQYSNFTCIQFSPLSFKFT